MERQIIYPLAGLPRPGQIWSWISFDVANQSFTLIINTLLFSIFFQDVVVSGRASKNTLWSALFASSMILVVLASPIAGAIADGQSSKKKWLIWSGVVCAICTCLLALIRPDQLWLAVLLYVPANFAFNIGENFLASFLPHLAPRDAISRVSGFSWGVAYAAALVMLLLVAGAMTIFKLQHSDQWRPFFVAAGLWFLVFLLPTFRYLKEEHAPRATQGSPLRVGFARLLRTLREAKNFRDLAMLLAASFFYGGGMSVVVSFASILAKDFGLTETQLVLFIAVITVSGIVGTLIPTFLQDRVGHRTMTLALLAVWVITTLYLALIAHRQATSPNPAAFPHWPIWIGGNLLGFGLGSLGTANRAFFGAMTPQGRSGEFFGLWGLVFKLAAVLTIPFGIVKDRAGKPAALLVLAGMIVVGFVLTLCINERRGIAAAGPQE